MSDVIRVKVSRNIKLITNFGTFIIEYLRENRGLILTRGTLVIKSMLKKQNISV